MAKDKIIIALSGRKQAGKNAIAEFMRLHFFDKHGISTRDQHGQPIIIQCSFADNLKGFCINTLGVKHDQCYGTEEQKNSPTEYLWESVSEYYRWKFGSEGQNSYPGYSTEALRSLFYDRKDGFISMKYPVDGVDFTLRGHRTGPMSARDIMQIFGTDLIRETFGNVWAKATIRKIKSSRTAIMGLITDNRFPNEVEAVLDEPKGHVIRLTRSPLGTTDQHPSEAALDGYDWDRNNCYVLDNADMTIEEQNVSVMHIIDNKIMSGEINE